MPPGQAYADALALGIDVEAFDGDLRGMLGRFGPSRAPQACRSVIDAVSRWLARVTPPS